MTTHTYRIKVARTFYEDHYDRFAVHPDGEHLNAAPIIEELSNSKRVTIDATLAQLTELRSDAHHYEIDNDLRMYERSLSESAARVVAAIDKALS